MICVRRVGVPNHSTPCRSTLLFRWIPSYPLGRHLKDLSSNLRSFIQPHTSHLETSQLPGVFRSIHRDKQPLLDTPHPMLILEVQIPHDGRVPLERHKREPVLHRLDRGAFQLPIRVPDNKPPDPPDPLTVRPLFYPPGKKLHHRTTRLPTPHRPLQTSYKRFRTMEI